MTDLAYEGGCLCGAVRYRCSAKPFVAYTCHCQACQRLTSSAFATSMHVATEALDLYLGDVVIAERLADSGNALKTSRCAQCGTALFILNSARPRAITVLVGTLDEPRRADVDVHIWTKRKLPWVRLPEEHKSYPEAGDFRRYYADDPSRLVP
ncbi:MAG: GFA family protein [Myxococcota bacterium]